MASKKERVYLFDNLKFILMVIVVFGHCIEPFMSHSRLLKGTFVFIYFFHMPAFIFIAGLFSKNTIKDRHKTLNHVCYLLILFLLLKIFISFLEVVFYHEFAFDLFHTEGVAWFLLVLAYYFAFTYLVRNVDWRSVLLLSVLFACLAGYTSRIGSFMCLSRAITYYPFFYIGYLWDVDKLLAFIKEKRKPAMVAGIGVIVSAAYLCIFQLPLVLMVRPLFSGKYPYSKLAYPMSGGLQRLIYYPAVLIFIISMIVLTPDKKLPFTEAGKRTLQIYFWHFSLIVPLKVLGVFTYITEILPGILRWLAFLAIALGITIFFSLPFWGYPFRYLKKILSRDSSRS